MTGNAIEVTNLHKSFGAARALDGLDLTVATGENPTPDESQRRLLRVISQQPSRR